MRIAFAGTPEFAAAGLDALIAAGHEIALVLTQPDRPAGRGMKLQAPAVKTLARQHGLDVVQPRSLRLDGRFPQDAQEAAQALTRTAPACLIVAAYGLILPRWVLDLPPLGCLNIHASLLPRWRGAAPIHRAIEAGDTRTGITIMQMDAGLDTGDMLLAEALAIDPADTTGRLHDRLAALGARLIVQTLAAVPSLPPQPQPHEGVTYAHKIEKAEAPIDWRQPAAVIERRIRAFDPFPGATFSVDGDVVKLWSARVEPNPGLPPGQVIEASGDRLVVACGEGALALLQLQRPGGRRTDAGAWLHGAGALAGRRLE